MLSPEKTKIIRIEDGFDFLGQHLQKFHNKLIITPSKENRKSFFNKVRKEIKAHRGMKCENMINRLNPRIRGWVDYHKNVQSSETFSHADTVIFYSLLRWAKRRHSDKSLGWIEKKYFSLSKRNWLFSCKAKYKHGNVKVLELLKPSFTGNGLKGLIL